MYAYLKNTTADIYIGKNAGKRVRKRIKNASKSIRIISPYLSDSLITDLILKKEQGVSVQLVTSSDILNAPKVGKIIRQLVSQIKTTRPHAQKWYNFGQRLHLPAALTAIAGGFLWHYYNYIALWQLGLFILGSILICWFLGRITVYDYSYSPSIETTCLLSPGTVGYDSGLSLFHAKLYIIDEKTAFLGSLNYTWPGMKYNTESCIEISTEKDVRELLQYFSKAGEEEPIVDLTEYGPKFFAEPKN